MESFTGLARCSCNCEKTSHFLCSLIGVDAKTNLGQIDDITFNECSSA